MENGLVIVEDSAASKALLEEAGAYAASQDATVVLFAMLSTEELERTVSTLDQIGDIENTTYSAETAMEQARSFLEDTAKEVLDDTVEYETVCTVLEDDDRVAATLSAADDADCDHVFTAGKKRSPTGKALFGDFTQSLLLQFDGCVTVDLRE